MITAILLARFRNGLGPGSTGVADLAPRDSGPAWSLRTSGCSTGPPGPDDHLGTPGPSSARRDGPASGSMVEDLVLRRPPLLASEDLFARPAGRPLRRPAKIHRTLLRSPDEGTAGRGSERLIWSKDGKPWLLLVGRHFFVRKDLFLDNGDQLYFLHHLGPGRKGAWSTLARVSDLHQTLTASEIDPGDRVHRTGTSIARLKPDDPTGLGEASTSSHNRFTERRIPGSGGMDVR